MLLYFGRGERHYATSPVAPRARHRWEFQAVLRGRIAVQERGRARPAEAQRLWLFHPLSPHGWTAPRGPATVAVFHFTTVPEPLASLVPPGGERSMPLDRTGRARIQALVTRIEHYRSRPSVAMVVAEEHARLELSLMMLEALGAEAEAPRMQGRLVDRALGWYVVHLARNPGQKQVAAATGVSVAHLRRLFHRELGAGPKRVFDQLRFQRALELMEERQLPLAEVAARCGFGGPSAFSRGFRQKFGRPPSEFRPSPH